MKTPQDYANMFRDSFDFSNVTELQRRQAEVLSATSQMIVENTQAIFQRQAELAQTSTKEVIEASREALSAGTPEAGMAKQAELAKSLFEGSVENVREVSEMIAKSGFEAFDMINQATAESISDLQKKPNRRKKAS